MLHPAQALQRRTHTRGFHGSAWGERGGGWGGVAWRALQCVEGPRVPPPAINRAGGEDQGPGGRAGEQWLIDGDRSRPEWLEQYLDLQHAGVIGCNCRLVKFPAGVSEQGVAVKRPATSFLLH